MNIGQALVAPGPDEERQSQAVSSSCTTVCHHAQPEARVNKHEPRDYQLASIADFWSRVETEWRKPILVAPTGSGKTVTAAEIIRQAVEKGQRVVVVVHRRELVRQTSRKLYDAGVKNHGIIAAGFPPRPTAPVQIASVQTLYARALRTRKIDLPPAELVVVDECHHARARIWHGIINAYPGAVILGLTATPARGDGRGLGNIFDYLIESATIPQLIERGFLVQPIYYAPSKPDLEGVHVRHGDYVESELAERMNTKKLVGDIAEQLHKITKGERRVTSVKEV